MLTLTYLMRPIMEPDFFWHLKTGEWIWQHKVLPGADPFSFMGPQAPDARQLVILQGYWLAQLTYHAFVSIFGFWGVFLLRVVMLAAFFGLFLWMFERHRVNRLLAVSLLALFSIFFLENYALERPQVISFLAIGLLFILYRRVRDYHETTRSPMPSLVAVFLLLAVWSNMHGGVVLGQGALLVMALVESGIYLRTGNRPRVVRMLIFTAVGVAGSLLAPAQLGLGNLLSLAGAGAESFASSQSQTNFEYYSVYTWLVVNQNFKLLIPIALSIISLFALKEAVLRNNFAELVLLSVFWIFAYRHVRYLPVAMVFSLLFIAWNYRPGGHWRFVAWSSCIAVLVSVAMWTSNDFHHLARTSKQGLIDRQLFPVGAADFLQKQGVRGWLFNTVNWGGFLIWRLAPEIQVAGDGRVLDEAAYEEVVRCSKGETTASGRPLWKDFVDRHAINVALVPLMNGPKPSTLAQGFARDSEWQQVFRDQVSVVFARRVPLSPRSGT